MLPVQVYHRACTIGTVSTVSTVSVTPLVWQAKQVELVWSSMLGILRGIVSKTNMASMVDMAGMGDSVVRKVIVRDLLGMSTLGRVHMETTVGRRVWWAQWGWQMVGTVSMVHGRHFEYSERGRNGSHGSGHSVTPCWVAGPGAKVASHAWTWAHTA